MISCRKAILKKNKYKTYNTMKKKVGQVTPEEKNEIQQLFERRNDLMTLVLVTIPLYLLYEVSIFVLKRMEKRKSARATT